MNDQVQNEPKLKTKLYNIATQEKYLNHSGHACGCQLAEGNSMHVWKSRYCITEWELEMRGTGTKVLTS